MMVGLIGTVLWLPGILGLLLLNVINPASAACNDLNSTFQVSEDTPVETILASITAYNLTVDKSQSAENVDVIGISNENGNWTVKLKKELDAENMTAIELKVKCQDIALIPATARDFRLVIEDVNEFAPVFQKLSFTISIDESTAVSSTVFTFNIQNKATDHDATGNTVTYSIVDDADGRFRMSDVQQGTVILIKTLDYESGPNNFTLNISAKDSGIPIKESFSTLIINVQDVDDVNPVFSNPSYKLSIPEGDYSGNEWFETTPILSAKDGDGSLDASIAYTIDNSTESLYPNVFSVAQNGSLSVNGRLDIGRYSVNVKAYQVDNPLLRYALAVVVVTVTDINNHHPVMSKSNYSATVSEALPVNTIVMSVTARDEDQGNNSAIEFILGNNATFVVETDGNFGTIKLKHPLDREKQDRYTFQVWARETLSKEHYESNKSYVTITVTDENDNSPVFVGAPYQTKLLRTDTKGHNVVQVDATDLDIGENGEVSYSLQPSSFSLALLIDSITGMITLARDLTAADVGSYQITVNATDNATDVGLRRSSFAQLMLNIMPVRDHAPKFTTPSPYSLSVPETTLVQKVIGQVRAEDEDGDVISYTMLSANPSNYLRVDPTNGTIQLIKSVDLDSDPTEPPQNISMTVLASDSNNYSASIDVTVSFTYVNEFSPTFKLHSTFYVLENATTGQTVGTVEATDNDRGQDGDLTFMLMPSSLSSMFKINKTTGVISMNCSSCLDYDRIKDIDLVVKVVDGGIPQLFDLTSVHIKVNETVLSPPAFVSKVYTASTLENQPAHFLLQLFALDPDTPQDHLLFGSTEIKPLRATSNITVLPNGTVFLNSPIDAEELNSISVDVSVTDGTNSDSATVNVTVIDINDNYPKLNITSPVSVPENATVGQTVTVVGATDADITNEGFTFLLGNGADGKFHINSDTGELTVNGHFDRRLKMFYNLSISVMDHGSPPLTTTQYLKVDISDSNTSPVFVDASNNTVNSYQFDVGENLTIGDLVGSLHASDPDRGSSGELSFSIASGNADKVFVLNSKTGELTLSKPLNFEQQSLYVLTAVVTDRSFQPKSSDISVTVSVLNVIEAPRWPLPLPKVYLTQSSTCIAPNQVKAFSQEVTSVSSTGDEDVEYNLLNNTNEFSIDNKTGLLQVDKTLQEGEYVIGIQACSAGTSVCSEAALTVVIKTDDILTFCPAFYQAMVNESALVNDTIKDLYTNKKDSEYSIQTGNKEGKFGIDANTGRLYVAQQLDREATSRYTLVILAKGKNSQQSAEAQINIEVLDINDSPPQFQSQTYEGEISEAMPNGSAVLVPSTTTNKALVVAATDADENPQLTYSINSDTDTSSGAFAIDAQGALTLIKEVDFDSMPLNLNGKYTFNVTVTDGIYNSTVLVTVEILDANDNYPQFDDPSDLQLTVQEGEKVPKNLAKINASDRDALDSGKLVFAISPSDVDSHFSIDSRTGQLKLIDVLDGETQDEYIFNVTVTDSANHVATKTVNVTVIVNHRPTFPTQIYNMTVEEGEDGVNTNLSIDALDPDTGRNGDLTYSIISGNINSSFQIVELNNRTWLKTVKALDREALVSGNETLLKLEVIAQDNGTVSKTGTCTILVLVTDINDSPPVFNVGSGGVYTAKIAENSANFTMVSLSPVLKVTDADSAQFGRPSIQFSLLPSDAPFTIVSNSTDVSIFVNLMTATDVLDRETKDSYQLKIIATDFHGAGLNATAVLIINVTDINDEAPAFLKTDYNFNVSQNAIRGTRVGSVKAEDKDITGDVILYELSQNSLFGINPLSGEVSLLGALADEQVDEYRLNVTACDEIPNCGNATINIRVESTNDHCPVWNKTTLTMFATEGQNASWIGQLVATDEDRGVARNVIYFTNDTGSSKFIEVDPNGNVKLLVSLDADNPAENKLNFTVYATDGGISSCSVIKAILHIVVKGVNDNDPEIGYNGQYGIDVIKLTVIDKSQPGDVIGRIDSRDNDTDVDGAVTLGLSGDCQALDLLDVDDLGFMTVSKQINLTDLETSGKLDKNNSVTCNITATDGGNPPRSTYATLVVTFVSWYNVIPAFNQSSYTMNVTENEDAGTYVGTVVAATFSKDAVMYNLSVSTQSFPFMLDPHSGKISTAAWLDREATAEYHFIVMASNSKVSQYPAFAKVVVNVLDKNDQAPQFDVPSGPVWVNENENDTDIIDLNATDADTGVNAEIKYSLLTSNLSHLFHVNETNGVLSLAQPLDRETVSSYNINIQAQDEGTPSLSSTVEVQVKVRDVNDNAPKFLDTEYEISIPNKVGQQVMTVTATDDDDGPDNNQILYSLLCSLQCPFFIDPVDGKIETLRVLKSDSYNITVRATDKGQPPLHSDKTVYVTVLENKTAVIPTLRLSEHFIPLFVGMEKGKTLPVNITTKEVISLQLLGNGTDMFRLDNGTKIITLDKKLDKETVYVLNITATSSTGYVVSEVLQAGVVNLKFDQQSYYAFVPENKKNTTILDVDSFAERQGIPVKYSLAPPVPGFQIISSSGVIWLNQPLDRETSAVIMLNISLSLAGQSKQTRKKRNVGTGTDEAYSSVLVMVTDENDNPPTFGNVGPELYLSVPVDVNASYLITTLKAFDSDDGENGKIRYGISAGDDSTFDLNPSNGELRVAKPENLRGKDQETLTVNATDRYGSGYSVSLKLIISIVEDSNQYVLPTPLSLSTLQQNEQVITGNLSKILDFKITVDNLDRRVVDGVERSDIRFHAFYVNTNTSVPTREIQEKVSEKQEEIASLFDSFLKVRHRSSSGDSPNIASIALIAVAGIMFLVSLVAILIVYRLWRKQKDYAEKEENAAKVRQKMEEHMNGSTTKETSFASDPDEHLELDIDLDDSQLFSPEMFLRQSNESENPVPIIRASKRSERKQLEEQEKTFYFDVEEKPAGKNTIVLRQQVIDKNIQRMQSMFLENDALDDSGVGFPNHSDSEKSGQESPSSAQGTVKEDKAVVNNVKDADDGKKVEENGKSDGGGMKDGIDTKVNNDQISAAAAADRDSKTRGPAIGLSSTGQKESTFTRKHSKGPAPEHPSSPQLRIENNKLPTSGSTVVSSASSTAPSNSPARTVTTPSVKRTQAPSKPAEVSVPDTQNKDEGLKQSPSEESRSLTESKTANGFVNPAFTQEDEDDLPDHIESITYF